MAEGTLSSFLLHSFFSSLPTLNTKLRFAESNPKNRSQNPSIHKPSSHKSKPIFHKSNPFIDNPNFVSNPRFIWKPKPINPKLSSHKSKPIFHKLKPVIDNPNFVSTLDSYCQQAQAIGEEVPNDNFKIVLKEICCEFKTVTVVSLVTSTSRKNNIYCQESDLPGYCLVTKADAHYEEMLQVSNNKSVRA
ncbi:hypothetical protein C5167_009016 [Papaver somniferum]|uniref:Uncharacterized protein n=1 Tax=Papaver somniferum TaxID=3469 RepID=A0A4Y7JXA6_PAPSO|nr:hypothetical protein C5167_009016 [Papaver somniferum]